MTEQAKTEHVTSESGWHLTLEWDLDGREQRHSDFKLQPY